MNPHALNDAQDLPGHFGLKSMHCSDSVPDSVSKHSEPGCHHGAPKALL